MQERSIREEENNKGISFTKMRSGEREIYSQVRLVGRAFFQRFFRDRFRSSFIFSTSSYFHDIYIHSPRIYTSLADWII